MADRTTISDQTRITLAVVAAVIGAVITGTLGFSAIAQRLDAAVLQNMETRDHLRRTEDRVKAIENLAIDVAGIKRDVEWLVKSEQEARQKRSGD